MNNDMPTVAVLMSTYNGERYIREQLDSIFTQQGVNIKLFVRDDGSSDDTIGILEEYAQNNPVEIYNDGEKVGPGESFMRLVYKYVDKSDVDFYAFADQDDIWLDDKLSIAIRSIVRCRNDGPILYSSNQYLYVDGQNKGNRHKEKQSVALIPHMTKNTIAGCTFVFNNALGNLITDADRPDWRVIKYRLHDAWFMLVAIVCGYVIYDETAHMLYRLHSDNTVGVNNMSFFQRFKRLKRYFVKQDDSNLRMITAHELLRLYPEIKEENERILKLYAYYQRSWEDKKALAFDKEVRLKCLENPNVFTIKAITNFV